MMAATTTKSSKSMNLKLARRMPNCCNRTSVFLAYRKERKKNNGTTKVPLKKVKEKVRTLRRFLLADRSFFSGSLGRVLQLLDNRIRHQHFFTKSFPRDTHSNGGFGFIA